MDMSSVSVLAPRLIVDVVDCVVCMTELYCDECVACLSLFCLIVNQAKQVQMSLS